MSIDKYDKSRESEYCKSYSYSSEVKEERSSQRDSHRDDEGRRDANGDNGQYPFPSGTRMQPRIKYLVFGILGLRMMTLGMERAGECLGERPAEIGCRVHRYG
ncbi:MAG: hypothetical protein IKH26_13610 [Bacteroidaceae bacterium]|nr:hypothetical protein [Bacteroidaceae bacterium]